MNSKIRNCFRLTLVAHPNQLKTLTLSLTSGFPLSHTLQSMSGAAFVMAFLWILRKACLLLVTGSLSVGSLAA